MSIEIARKVLRIEAEAIGRVLDRLDESFGRAGKSARNWLELKS